MVDTRTPESSRSPEKSTVTNSSGASSVDGAGTQTPPTPTAKGTTAVDGYGTNEQQTAQGGTEDQLWKLPPIAQASVTAHAAGSENGHAANDQSPHQGASTENVATPSAEREGDSVTPVAAKKSKKRKSPAIGNAKKREVSDDFATDPEEQSAKRPKINESTTNGTSQVSEESDVHTEAAVNSGVEVDAATEQDQQPKAKRPRKRKASSEATTEQKLPSKRPKKKKTQKVLEAETAAEAAAAAAEAEAERIKRESIVQAKIKQVHTLINSHPELSLDRNSVSIEDRALSIGADKLQVLVNKMQSDWNTYLSPSPEANHPLFAIDDIVMYRVDRDTVIIDLSKTSLLEETIKANITGHGLEFKNLLKVEIEMDNERVQCLAKQHPVGRFRPTQADILLKALGGAGFRGYRRELSPLDQARPDLLALERTPAVGSAEWQEVVSKASAHEPTPLEQETDANGDRVLGACPRPRGEVA